MSRPCACWGFLAQNLVIGSNEVYNYLKIGKKLGVGCVLRCGLVFGCELVCSLCSLHMCRLGPCYAHGQDLLEKAEEGASTVLFERQAPSPNIILNISNVKYHLSTWMTVTRGN